MGRHGGRGAQGSRTDLTDREIREETVKVRVYRCPGKRGTGRCEAPSVIVADALEEVVYRQVDPVIREADARAQDEDKSEEMTDLEDALIAEADDALMEMSTLAKRREFGEDWSRMISQIRAEKAEAVRQRDALSEVGLGAGVHITDPDSMTEGEWLARRRNLLGAVFVRKMPRGAAPEARVRVLFRTDELPALGGPRNRIPPTPAAVGHGRSHEHLGASAASCAGSTPGRGNRPPRGMDEGPRRCSRGLGPCCRSGARAQLVRGGGAGEIVLAHRRPAVAALVRLWRACRYSARERCPSTTSPRRSAVQAAALGAVGCRAPLDALTASGEVGAAQRARARGDRC